MKKMVITFGVAVLGVGTCLAGWLNPTQQGFVIQTFTTYEPMRGKNSGTIVQGPSFAARMRDKCPCMAKGHLSLVLSGLLQL